MPEPLSSAEKGMSPFGRTARRVLWSLPNPVKERLSTAYRKVSPPAPPPGETIDYPADIADSEEVRTFLADTDVFGSAVAEGEGYIAHALERFRITLAITPTLGDDDRVLELGSNPYYFTRLLERRGIDVTCANWFGDGAEFGTKGQQTVSSPRTGESREFVFDHFNIEEDRFPYEEQTFALVYFCEILEHLPLDPVNALVEIHRVLRKPGGVLILSTPNPARSENLVKMIRGDNVYEPLSGYGVHGRHNREYTVAELQLLLSELGFIVERVFTADVSPSPPRLPTSISGRVELADRGEYVFVVARAVGPDRWRFPEWLYQSRHALSRAVLPDLEVGRNDDLQCQGFHAREKMVDRYIRWMGKESEATVLLSPSFRGPAILRIEGSAPPAEVGDIELRALVAGTDVSAKAHAGDGWFTMRFPIDIESGDQHVALRTDRTWSPVDIGLSADDRELSVAIASVGLERPAVESSSAN